MLINACSGFICSGTFQVFSVEYIDGLLAFRKVDNGLGCLNRHFHFTLTGEGGGTYYDGEYAVMGDKVGSPNFAAKYRELQWGY